MKRTPLCLAIASLMALSVVQATESPADDAQTAQARDDAGGIDPARLDEVTVTARKREETLQDVPISVTAFTAQALEKLNVSDISDLAGKVPNLTIYAARGSNSTLTAYIRGIGQSDPLWGFEPGVGIYLDDVYIARPQGALLDVFDVERIEVLRGPQGTLYGKNTVGGALKYISRPLPAETEGFASVTVGNYAQRDIKAAIGGGSDDARWRGRIALASLDRDGFGENRVTGEDVSDKDTVALRGSIGFFPNDHFNAQLAFDGVNDHSNVRGAKRLAVNRFDPSATPPNASNYDVQSGMPNVNETETRGQSLTLNLVPGGDFTFKSVTAYRKSDTATNIDFDTLQARITDVRAYYDDDQLTQEFQLNYDAAGAFHGVAGLFLFRGEASGLVLNNFLNASFGSTSGTVETDSLALYADGTYQFNEAFSVSGGIRYTREEKTADVLNRTFTDATFATPVATTADFKDSVSTNNVSPRISLDYHVTPDVLLYASASRGFKSGGFNIRANVAAAPDSARPFKDEQVDAFEIGNKLALMDGRFHVNTALFHNTYRDIQLSVFTSYTLPNGTQGFFGDFTNAGRATVNGAEVEFAFKPDVHWTFSGNLAFLDPEYDEYIDRGVNIASRQRFTNAPAFQGGLNVEYTTDLGAGALTARVGYRHQTKVVPTTDLSTAIAQDEYGLLDAAIVWDTGTAWNLALRGTNLTDRSYRTTGYNIPALGILTGFYGPPRQVSVTATYAF
ncbi:TonB-dependent receptor [Tahibacter amnicola]|uniref:TonB-dependent receptor n=1 Tax=Tahibacter amnicola TaxID=2976241 RepID=A0ABY6BHF2_9GAMM|nr:TonB-dependent receptor [Tahibacter amnicola]UXI69453.1 TonB-dependent receptor [Tahibacter amnicola]